MKILPLSMLVFRGDSMLRILASNNSVSLSFFSKEIIIKSIGPHTQVQSSNTQANEWREMKYLQQLCIEPTEVCTPAVQTMLRNVRVTSV